MVNLLVQNSNSLLEDLRRLNQLKDSSILYDVVDNQSKQPQISTKKQKLKRW